MGYFNSTIAAQLAGEQVRAAELVFFDFVDQPMRLWRGAGPLHTNDGHDWEGTGGLGEISGLDMALGTNAPSATFKITGLDIRTIALAKTQSAAVKDRDVSLYLQFFDAGWAPFDSPMSLWAGRLDRMTYSVADGVYSVSVSAESMWTGRNKPPYAFYTDTDQRARFAGDRGLEQMGSLVGKIIRWPVY